MFCLTTGPKFRPKRALHIVRSRASSFKWEFPLLFLRSSSSFLRLLLRIPVTHIPPFIFPSITRCRRQFLRKMWPIQFAFRLRISWSIFLCFLTQTNYYYCYHHHYIKRKDKRISRSHYVLEKETLTQIFIRDMLFHNTVTLLSHQSQKFSHLTL